MSNLLLHLQNSHPIPSIAVYKTTLPVQLLQNVHNLVEVVDKCRCGGLLCQNYPIDVEQQDVGAY